MGLVVIVDLEVIVDLVVMVDMMNMDLCLEGMVPVDITLDRPVVTDQGLQRIMDLILVNMGLVVMGLCLVVMGLGLVVMGLGLAVMDLFMGLVLVPLNLTVALPHHVKVVQRVEVQGIEGTAVVVVQVLIPTGTD